MWVDSSWYLVVFIRKEPSCTNHMNRVFIEDGCLSSSWSLSSRQRYKQIFSIVEYFEQQKNYAQYNNDYMWIFDETQHNNMLTNISESYFKALRVQFSCTYNNPDRLESEKIKIYHLKEKQLHWQIYYRENESRWTDLITMHQITTSLWWPTSIHTVQKIIML